MEQPEQPVDQFGEQIENDYEYENKYGSKILGVENRVNFIGYRSIFTLPETLISIKEAISRRRLQGSLRIDDPATGEIEELEERTSERCNVYSSTEPKSFCFKLTPFSH